MTVVAGVDAFRAEPAMGSASAQAVSGGAGVHGARVVLLDTLPIARAAGRVEAAAHRTLEICVALVGLLLVALALPLLAVAIRLDSPGPVIFRQRRLGRDGREFTVYKLRTMVADAEERLENVLPLNIMGGCTFKATDDPRRTRVGAWLRRLSLDEAPQFWNVLRGDMALVGPRPPLPSEAARYSAREWARLAVKPGITGMWQVSGRNLLPHDKMIDLDLDYVARRSLRLDVDIVVRTVPAMLRGRGAY